MNGVRCTAAFMDEIVENQEKYIGLPLCADTVNLVKGRYTKLGHCYNPKTGVYSSSIIGSFYRFEKEELDDGEVALIGYARVMKRNRRVCKAIGELFAEGALKFSFEISCGSYTELEDGTLLIDAADNNFIEGMCIVSFPACPEAVALELVAEINGIGKEADDMEDMIESAAAEAEVLVNDPAPESAETNADTKAIETVVAEVEANEVPAENEEVEIAETIEVAAEVEGADVPAEEVASAEPEKQSAAVYVTTETSTRETVDVYDNETGVSVTEVTLHEVRTHERIDEATLNVAEADVAAEEQDAQAAEQAEQIAEQPVDVAAPAIVPETPDFAKLIAEMQEAMNELRSELNELRAERVVAEAHVDETAHTINPFVAEITAPKRYSLLESDAPSRNSHAYSLLEKA